MAAQENLRHSDENFSQSGSQNIQQDPNVKYLKLQSGQMFGMEKKFERQQCLDHFDNISAQQNLERGKEVLPESDIAYEIEKFTHHQLRTSLFRAPLINIFGEKFRAHEKLSVELKKS